MFKSIRTASLVLFLALGLGYGENLSDEERSPVFGPVPIFQWIAQNTAGRILRLIPSGKHLPHHLKTREHDDYPHLFAWIPRGWTAFDWGAPKLLIGNQQHSLNGRPKPIGERRSFQISRFPKLPFPLNWMPLYFAVTTHSGYHFRLGARWDDVDDYTQVPSIAWKRKVE